MRNLIRYFYDDRDKISPGFKFNEWEMKGVPIRIEVGMRDLNDQSIVFSRRDNNVKKSIQISDANNYFSNVSLANSIFIAINS